MIGVDRRGGRELLQAAKQLEQRMLRGRRAWTSATAGMRASWWIASSNAGTCV